VKPWQVVLAVGLVLVLCASVPVLVHGVAPAVRGQVGRGGGTAPRGADEAARLAAEREEGGRRGSERRAAADEAPGSHTKRHRAGSSSAAGLPGVIHLAAPVVAPPERLDLPDVMPDEPTDLAAPPAPPPEPMIWHPSSFVGIYAALRESVPYIQECYRGWRGADPTLRGRIVTRFRVVQDPDDAERGVISEAEIEEGALGNPLMEGCVLNALSDREFGAPDEREIVVRYAIFFDEDYDRRVDRFADVVPAPAAAPEVVPGAGP